MAVDILHNIFDLDAPFLVWKAIKDNMLPDTKDKEIYLTDIKRFCSLCDNLAIIGKPINDLDKCFHLSLYLWPKYQDFRLAILSKATYPTFSQFVLTLKGHEQVLLNNQVEKKCQIDYAQAFLGQHGSERGHSGWFQSQGYGFNSREEADSSKSNNESQWNNGHNNSKTQHMTSNKSSNTNPIIC